MTGNKCYLDEYEDYDGGFVSFGDGKGIISRKGKIKTGSLDFDDVYFCKELKYNMFSVSQICNKKNNVLFTDTEWLVLSSNFKLLDESQVLLRVPRNDNIYSVDLKSVVPTRGLTCLIAKAIIDESNTWHRRLGHINFKTMNKLVKGNLVKGLPSKIFENDHSCVACQKGKQHKASYKTKLVNSISKPLHMLHMDLFGPTNVKSLMKKSYCLVVTDDFSRFSWVFFLATKDETSGILKTFITEIENQLDHKVKVIRSDNGTEFKNSIMNQFCEMKGIKREFSVARTPQQNGVAERKNRTLIEAARTMLVDSKLPTTFWAEAVNTACYVLNRVLVIKPHNKTPYELIRGRPPLIDFMKPFGCPVTILNTRDHLGKFDGKADEGYFVGYYVVSKAMRVFNKRIRIVEETLNIRFLKNTPNVKGNGPAWLFDVDSLSISMNYVPVAAGNKTNGIVGTKDNIVAGQAQKEKEPEQEYILIPLCITDPLIYQGPKDYEGDDGMKPTEVDENEASDKSGKHDQEVRSESERLNQREMQTEHINSSNGINTVNTHVSTAGPSFDIVVPSTPVNTVGPSVSTANEFEEQLFENFILSKCIYPSTFLDTSFTKFHKDHPKDQVIGSLKTPVQTRHMTKINEEHGLISLVHKLRRTNYKDFQNCLFACFLSQMGPKKPVQALKDPKTNRQLVLNGFFRNKKDEIGIVVKNKARLVAQGHTQEKVYQIDVKSDFLYGKIEEEVYVCQPPGFEDPHFPDKVYKVEKALYGLHQAPRAWYETLSTYLLENGFHRGQIDKTLFIKRHKDDILLVQVYVDDIIFGSTKKQMSNEFETLMHDKFQMSSMGELSFFLGLQVKQKSDGIFISQDKYVAEILKKFDFASVKTASTPMETNKALIKDEEAEDVDVHLYRSMIGSLMYLTASRPDIMFAVCACARDHHKLNSNQIPLLINQSTSSAIQEETKSKGKQEEGKQEVAHDEIEHEQSVPTPSNDPQPSGEDSIQLNDLMVLCTKLQKQVLDLEKAKSDQDIEIANIKKRVDKLEKRRKFKTTGLKRLKKVGASIRIESSNDSLVNETQERQDEDLIFDTGVLDGDEMFVDATTGEKYEQSTKINDSTAGEAVTTAGVEDSTAPTIQVSTADIGDEGVTAAKIDELTLAQTLIEIKAAKPKVVITAATTTTTTRPKARGVVVQEPSEFRTSPEAQPSKSKDKGKAIMIEPEVPLKRKDQVALDEDLARNIQAQLDAEIIEEERLERQKQEEANIALIESWENTQAMMVADRLLDEIFPNKRNEELSDE
ncbi:putative ribonuclease H-like domain-containing protein [Tanacetum coccineum]|uniref:Ribonuclease H-like domain-containing protein n=1 Tax=Tanacetum coccineum TaxID=301880 RepID=A0ABQ5FLL7_9ASTR